MGKQCSGLFLVWCLCACFSVEAQPIWQSWNTSNSVLPDNTVRALATDQNDNLWIGTENGLARFDGLNFEVFTSGNSPLPDNSVRSLAVQGNKLWIGTFSAGLVKREGTSWISYHTGNSGLPDNQVRAIATGPNGEIWVGTTGGLARLHNNLWTVWDMTNSGFTSNNITGIALAADGSRYLSTFNGGLLHQTDSTLQVFNYLNSGLPDNSATALRFAPDGKLLIGTTTAGLVVLENDSVFTSYSPANSDNVTFSVPALATDSVNNWFLGSELAGLVQYSTGNWTNYSEQNSDLPGNYIEALLAKNTGELWIGTKNGGLARLLYQPLSTPADLFYQPVLHPNPALSGSEIYLKTNLVYPCISVRSSTGRLVWSAILSAEVASLKLPSLPAGLYFVTVISAGKAYHQKLVVQ